MELSPLFTWCLLCTFAVLQRRMPACHGKPVDGVSLESFDGLDFNLPYNKPLAHYGLNRLRRGYYYVEDGFISAVPERAVVASGARRRLDTNVNAPAGTKTATENRYYPLLDYRQTHTNRKKLFVPNLFG